MSKRMRILRRDLLGKVATLSMGAAILAGCSSAVERLGPNPYYTASTDNQREIMNGSSPAQPSFQDIVNGPGGTAAGLPSSSGAPVTTASIPQSSPVQSAPLPAPVASSAQTAERPAATPVATLPAPETLRQTVAARETSWKGWSSAGGTRVQVGRGDSLASISRRYGVPIQAVAAVNGIEDPSKVRAGQSLVIPVYVYSGGNGSTSTTEGETRAVKLPVLTRNEPVTTASVPVSSASAPMPGRKPYAQPSFAQLNQQAAPVQEAPVRLASAQPMPKPGRRGAPMTTASVPAVVVPAPQLAVVPVPLRQPVRQSAGQSADQPVVRTASLTNAPVTVRTTAISLPSNQVQSQPVASQPEQAVEVASIQPQAETGSALFRWPVRGRIISDFGAKPGGGRNEGVNLAVPEGTPVKAAGDGTVIYSGNELKGYGNLVLIRHDEGWVSAYAHNSVLNVKRGDAIRRGDTVALAGATGSVNQPQVHFELRQGNKPVDPLKYLPRR